MKLVAILMDGHKATITLPDNQVHTIDNLAENLDALKTILETADFEGGYVTGCDEYLVPTNFGIMPVAQWISETYNVPFVFSDAENFEAKAKDNLFQLAYYGFTPGKDEYSIESLLTVGNGLFIGLAWNLRWKFLMTLTQLLI